MVPLEQQALFKLISPPTVRTSPRASTYIRAAQLIGSSAPGYSSGQAQAALEEVAKETLPSTMGYDWADLSYQENKASGTAGKIFALSLLVVFLILAALYESWTLPFSVLLSALIAILGAFAGLYLRKFDLDIYAQIGLVMLIGLAAKNAILIVEFARDEMHKGKDVVDAALEGAKLRLRPILMTSFAFILGCVPLAIATGSGAEGRKILGTVVVTGMLAATALAIFIIPVLFVIFERIALKLHEGPWKQTQPPSGTSQLRMLPPEGGVKRKEPFRTSDKHSCSRSRSPGAPSAQTTSVPPLTLRQHFAARLTGHADYRVVRRLKMADVFQDPQLQKLICQALKKINASASPPRAFCKRKRN